MLIDHEARRLLIREICSLFEGTTQCYAAMMLKLTQPEMSALRRGRGEGFSIGRLFRVLAGAGYNIEIHLKVLPRRFAKPRPHASVTVVRYDHFERAIVTSAPPSRPSSQNQ